MDKNKYKIRYLPSFISQFNNILYHITYELNNKIAANNLYKEVVYQIEKRSFSPNSYEVFRKTKEENINWYKIRVKNYIVFYVVKDNIMEVRRIYYSRRNFNKLI